MTASRDSFTTRKPSPYTLPDFLRKRLQEPLPGFSAQKRMGPSFEDGRLMHDQPPAPDCRINAVMLLLYEPAGSGSGGPFHLPLTVRSSRLPSHAGEISFPGGRMETGETPLEAALRETEEEIGIAASNVEPLGALSDLYIPVSRNIIKPQVGLLTGQPHFRLSTYEVSRLLTPPLRLLRDPGRQTQERWHLGGQPLIVPFWKLYDLPLWGATAMILSEFIELLKDRTF